MCSQLQSRHCQQNGGRRSLTVAFVQMPWVVLEDACLSIRCPLFRPLAEATPLLVPTFETGFGGSFFPSRIPKQPKLSSTSSTRRSHEGVGACRRLWEFTLLCADPTVASIGTSAAHAPNGAVPASVCLSHAASLESMPPSPGACRVHKLGFRSTASSLISSEVLPPLVGVPAEPIGAVPLSRISALSLDHNSFVFSWLPKSSGCCLFETSTVRTSLRVVLSPMDCQRP